MEDLFSKSVRGTQLQMAGEHACCRHRTSSAAILLIFGEIFVHKVDINSSKPTPSNMLVSRCVTDGSALHKGAAALLFRL